jgi:phage/plasmid-associated DNA primase
VKYVLLLGDGRNGKSVFLSMLEGVFGQENRSSVSRLEISEKSPVVTELLGSLVNIVYDGVAAYLKDSGNEKSLIAGEPIGVRKLYSSELTRVQTNALFIEGLNKEPKSSDKSSALQARLVRFWFPNSYPDDLAFRDRMLSEDMLGALLSLLIDHYVRKQDKAVMLAPTRASLQLQLEHMHTNSLALQFLTYLERTDPLGSECLIGDDTSELASRFQSWRVREGDMAVWSEPDIFELFRPVVTTERRSKRTGGKVRKVRTITGFKTSAAQLLASSREESDDTAAVVDE